MRQYDTYTDKLAHALYIALNGNKYHSGLALEDLVEQVLWLAVHDKMSREYYANLGVKEFIPNFKEALAMMKDMVNEVDAYYNTLFDDDELNEYIQTDEDEDLPDPAV